METISNPQEAEFFFYHLICFKFDVLFAVTWVKRESHVTV